MIGSYIKKNANGRRFAIGDIHGCFETFRILVENKIEFDSNDQLFLLGDYINRGPKPTKVIDYILQLLNNQYQVYPIRGNHEQMLLDDRGQELVTPYSDFFTNLPYYYETDDFYFLHAGLNFLAEKPLDDTYSMLWMRESSLPDDAFLGSKRVVHGHTIHSISEIVQAVQRRDAVLPLDNGCYRGLKGEIGVYGHLCALDLDTFELILQENVDRQA
jgi:serine/threonine protein phosphatase 1